VFASEQYQLVDFGQGRKLEQFGPFLIDRPCPVATRRRTSPEAWLEVDARFKKQADGREDWSQSPGLPASWTIIHRDVTLELRPTPFGHLGVFPEQDENWDWIRVRVRGVNGTPKVLNLFAYTGGATLAAAAAGAEVVHVDAAKNVVAWARRNADLSSLTHASIRWITEDAMVFVQRELRRGARYDALILDPPSYGHGPKGQAWKIERHLEPLLNACGALLTDEASWILMTCHTPRFTPSDLQQLLASTCIQQRPGQFEARRMKITSIDGGSLPSGMAVRWVGRPGRRE
jgi:23S rRNA (cytosine1962-C5)-methyltransferase